MHATPRPTFPASVRTRFALLGLITRKAKFVARAIFRGHFVRIPRLDHVNTRTRVRDGAIVYRNIRGLSNTRIVTASLHTSTDLILTNYVTRKAAIISHVCRVSHNCRHVRSGLHTLNTGVRHIGNRWSSRD